MLEDEGEEEENWALTRERKDDICEAFGCMQEVVSEGVRARMSERCRKVRASERGRM